MTNENRPPDYERIIKRLTAQVAEREEKMNKNQNEPTRFYYHRKQWMIVKGKLDKWTAEYEAYLQTLTVK
jgi:hypothetical protein